MSATSSVDSGADILVNNAGIFEEHSPTASDFEAWKGAWDRILAVNHLGPAHLSYLVASRMIDAGGGRIVNVSSRGTFRGEDDRRCAAGGDGDGQSA